MTIGIRPALKEQTAALVDLVRAHAQPLETTDDLDPLLEAIGDAHYVLLGEASHGTHEYYTWRARITQRLIREKGFSVIAVEGDWPPCYAVNRYLRGYDGAARSAAELLQTFDRWPTWMWANWEIVALTEWLREYNQGRAHTDQVGFYGLDVYSLWESMESVLHYLEQRVPEAVETARRAYFCFEPYGEDAQSYAWSTMLAPESCADEVVDLLREVRRRAEAYPGDPEASFNAEQNALVAVNAERYYRAMVRGDAESWNVRDQHMADTLDRLVTHQASLQGGRPVKAVVWEHNTHIGDARATDMARAQMVNVGQLVRERHAADGVVLVGCGSHRGTVIAGRQWGAPLEEMPVPHGQPQSWEAVLHEAGAHNQLLLLDKFGDAPVAHAVRGHRAIGVVYNPAREAGNYVPTRLPQRYDAFLYFDQSQALHPLHVEPAPNKPPETYPWGL
jgi:erythromycin esterase